MRLVTAGDARERLRVLTDIRRFCSQFDVADVERAVRANWDHADRLVRLAASDLLATLDEESRATLLAQARTPWQRLTWALAACENDLQEAAKQAGRVLETRDAPRETRLAAVRVMQRAVGDIGDPKMRGTVWEGYSLRNKEGASILTTSPRAALLNGFPSGDAELDREITRTLAMLEVADARLLTRVADRLTATSNPIDDVHYLIVLARLRGPRTDAVTKRVADALLNLDRKLTQQKLNRDTNWPLRIQELHQELAAKDGQLNATMVAAAGFGRPDHAIFADCPKFDRRRAAELFLKRAGANADSAWTPALVRLLGELPDETSLPVLRRLWENGGLEDAILPLLARRPDAADSTRFLEGLNSPRLATVSVCLDALDKLPRGDDAVLTLALIRALRSIPDGRENDKLRQRIAVKLRAITGERYLGDDKKAWTTWFVQKYPKQAAKLGNDDGVDVEAWNRRTAKIAWTEGNAERGQAVFNKASCASCHSGAQALGPDLRGAAGRFSREDLFTAIVQPSKDVSPRYRTTLIGTADGKTYQGIIIYEAVDSLILQTGPDATARLTNPRITERRVLTTSLMPAGLLDKLTDRDVADLYAYLKAHR